MPDAPSGTTLSECAWRYVLWAVCVLVLAFLILPILIIVPLSFSSGTFLTFPLPGLSLRWYQEFFTSAPWQLSLRNSLIVASATTALATVLGTLAALGLTRARLPGQTLLMGLIVSPMVVPLVIVAVGVYFAYAPFGLTSSLLGLTLAHTALAAPFVVITVSATLQGFDPNQARAGASLGASPVVVFRRIILPLILPGVISGALFAFVTSFDEVVLSIFLAGPAVKTLPVRIWEEIRVEYTPVVAVAATIMIAFALAGALASRLAARRAL
jgi:putative spermidine/putrescine transport system permease protein